MLLLFTVRAILSLHNSYADAFILYLLTLLQTCTKLSCAIFFIACFSISPFVCFWTQGSCFPLLFTPPKYLLCIFRRTHPFGEHWSFLLSIIGWRQQQSQASKGTEGSRHASASFEERWWQPWQHWQWRSLTWQQAGQDHGERHVSLVLKCLI